MPATEPWDPASQGIVLLPSGRLVRGRGLRHPSPSGPEPAFGVYLLGKQPSSMPWEIRWVRWPDFWLPKDPADTKATLVEAWKRTETERVEIACEGGLGRTGTALACLAVLDGVDNGQAVSYVREHYHDRAVEMPWQRRYVEKFTAAM